MKSSDPKQVAVLGTVAALAIGYLGFSLFGSSAPSAQPAAAPEKEASADEAEMPVQERLLRDPFNHPRLAMGPSGSQTNMSPEEAMAANMNALQAARMRSAEGAIEGFEARPLSPGPFGGFLPGSIDLSPTGEPGEKTGNDRQEKKRPRHRFVLSAVIEVGDPVAFLKVNGSESRAFRKQDLLIEGVRLIEIESDRVQVRSGKRHGWLQLGQEDEF
jgi:hypothetical protein